MKRLMFSLSLLLVTLSGFAQDYKVIEKSEKKRPTWVGVSGNGFISVTSVKPTLQEAQEDCMNRLMEEIISAVAVNVCTQTSSELVSITKDESMEFTEEFRSSSTIQSAVMPFLNNISISKADATYWEKQQDKKTKQINYEFSLLYPLSEAELKKYNQQFLEIDQEMVDKTRRLEANAKHIKSIEDIDHGSTEIKQCVSYFFDKVRRQWAEGIAEIYRKAPSRISLHGKQENATTYKVWLEFDGRKITPSGTPTMKSDCAENLQFSREGDDFLITYSTANCLEDEPAYLEVSFRVKGKVLKQKYPIE